MGSMLLSLFPKLFLVLLERLIRSACCHRCFFVILDDDDDYNNNFSYKQLGRLSGIDETNVLREKFDKNKEEKKKKNFFIALWKMIVARTTKGGTSTDRDSSSTGVNIGMSSSLMDDDNKVIQDDNQDDEENDGVDDKDDDRKEEVMSRQVWSENQKNLFEQILKDVQNDEEEEEETEKEKQKQKQKQKQNQEKYDKEIALQKQQQQQNINEMDGVEAMAKEETEEVVVYVPEKETSFENTARITTTTFIEETVVDGDDENKKVEMMSTTTTTTMSTTTATTATATVGSTVPELPLNILGTEIVSYVSDRTTYNNFSLLCKEIYNMLKYQSRYHSHHHHHQDTVDDDDGNIHDGETKTDNVHRPSSSTLSSSSSLYLLLPPWPETMLHVSKPTWSVAFAPNGILLAVGCGDGKIRLWDRRYGPLRPLVGHLGRVYAIVFSKDSKVMISGSGDGDIRIWDMMEVAKEVNDGGDSSDYTYQKLVTNCPHVDSLAMNHYGSDDGTGTGTTTTTSSMTLASAGDGTIRLWDVPTRTCLDVITEQNRVVESICFIPPDGKYLASGTWGKVIHVWDISTGRCVNTLHVGSCVHSIVASPDGKYLVSASDDRSVRVWKNFLQQHQEQEQEHQVEVDYYDMHGHTDSIWCVDYSSDGKYIASGSDDGTVRIWSSSTGKCLSTHDGHLYQPASHHNTMTTADPTIYSVAFSPDSTMVASASNDGYIELRKVLH